MLHDFFKYGYTPVTQIKIWNISSTPLKQNKTKNPFKIRTVTRKQVKERGKLGNGKARFGRVY